MAELNKSECSFTYYQYKLKSHTGTNNYIPIFVIGIPYTYDEAKETQWHLQTTVSDFVGSNILPFWVRDVSGQQTRFLEIYDDDFFNIYTPSDAPLGCGFKDSEGNLLGTTRKAITYSDVAVEAIGIYLIFLQTTDDEFIYGGGSVSGSHYDAIVCNTLTGREEADIVTSVESETTKGLIGNGYIIVDYYQGKYNDIEIRDRLHDLIKVSRKIDTNDPNNNSGNSGGGGGGGTSDIGGDEHPTGGTPTISPLDSGLLTLYNPTVDELQSLGKFLWSDSFDITAFKKLFNDPFDTLLGLSIVPVKPNISGTHNIIFGNLDSGVSTSVVSSPWVTIDCGYFTLNEVWNGALDYSPSTQVSIYLPFIGVKQLNTNDVMGGTLHLIYNFDVLTGACVAEISINHTSQGNKADGFSYNANMGSVYTFIGQCAVNVPLASQDFTNTIRAAIGAAGVIAGVGASIATGNAALGAATTVASQTAIKAGMTTAAIGGAAQGANLGMQATTPTVERSGALTSSASLLASLTPCLIVTRPHICKPEKYYALRGVPSQVYLEKLSKATGFLQIADIHNIRASGATDSELDEIKGYLSQGVYVTTWPTAILSKSDTLDIQLYNNTSAKNRIDKSLTGIRSGDNSLEGTFRDSCDLENPVVQIKINDVSDLNHCNYMYIGIFQRYYYITKITSYRNNVVEITGHVDPLMTYGYQIGQNSSILARSSQVSTSGYGNTYLDDAQLATYNDTYNVCYNWDYSFSHSNDSLILAVAGALSS